MGWKGDCLWWPESIRHSALSRSSFRHFLARHSGESRNLARQTHESVERYPGFRRDDEYKTMGFVCPNSPRKSWSATGITFLTPVMHGLVPSLHLRQSLHEHWRLQLHAPHPTTHQTAPCPNSPRKNWSASHSHIPLPRHARATHDHVCPGHPFAPVSPRTMMPAVSHRSNQPLTEHQWRNSRQRNWSATASTSC